MFENILAFLTISFAIGTIGFWIAVVVLNLIVLVSLDNDRGTKATIVLIIALCGLQWICGVPILGWIVGNPLTALSYIILYFGLGVLWSFVKWYLYVQDQARKYHEHRAEFQERKGLAAGTRNNPSPIGNLAEWKEHCRQYNIPTEALQVRRYKGKITTWIVYWPWSCLWTLINDPIRRLVNYLFEELQELYQSVARRAAKGVENDFNETKH